MDLVSHCHKFMPGDRVYIRQNFIDGRKSYPHGLAIVKCKHPHRDEYTCRMEGTQVDVAWYPADNMCLINRRGVMYSMLPDAAHVKLKLQGSAWKVEFFHWLLNQLDYDWPWKFENNYMPLKHCGACAGAIYPNPNLTADDVRNLAKQIDGTQRIAGGLKVDIKKFNIQARCTKVAGEDQDPATEVDTTEPKTPQVVVIEGGEE